MLLLLYFACLLVASNVQANRVQVVYPKNVKPTPTPLPDFHSEPNMFWKTIFNTYYDIKGLRNETTDKIVEDFFDHAFKAYPKELYPAFQKIFLHISESNDGIWNFYESILYLYHNVDAADRIYDTVLERLAEGKLMTESSDFDLDATLSSDEHLEWEYPNLQQRSGVFEDEPIEDFEPCEECGEPPLQVGSIRAIPGVHFPNYNEIPLTTFTCAEKHIPGFYADLETGCQVFHVCYPHRRESFLCPVGTIFNQAILACDYWYSSNCSLAPLYFITGPQTFDEHLKDDKESLVDHLLEQFGNLETTSKATRRPIDHPTEEPDDKKLGKPKSPKIKITLPNIDWTLMIKFLPIKSKITECPDFCGSTPAYSTQSTTITEPTESSTRPHVTPLSTEPPKKKYTTTARPVTTPTVATKPTSTTSHRPVVTPVPPKTTTTYRPPKKDEYGEKTAKSEILLDILKAVKLLTKDAEGFLTKVVEKKHQQHDVSKKPIVVPHYPTEKPKPFPEINQRFVVKPVHPGHLRRPTVTKSKLLKPSKQILKSKVKGAFQKKDPAKLVLEGMKAIAHLFE